MRLNLKESKHIQQNSKEKIMEKKKWSTQYCTASHVDVPSPWNNQAFYAFSSS